MRVKIELIFAVADKWNDAFIGYLCKGKPGGFVLFIPFFVFLTFSRTLLFYCAVCRNKTLTMVNDFEFFAFFILFCTKNISINLKVFHCLKKILSIFTLVFHY